MAQAIINQQDDRIALQTPFNPDFVNDLKNAVPYTDRAWDRTTRVWLVSQAEAGKAIEVTRRHFDVIDARGQSLQTVEEAQIDAEIAQIKANQAALLEREGDIDRILAALGIAIGRYSYTSKSYVKGALAKDRALLQHALNNARIPVEQLAELQVRGMAAALRLVEGGYKPPRGANVRL